MSAPNICIFTETFYPEIGGGETQARALAEGLTARGLRVTVLTRRSKALFSKVERLGGTTVYRLPPTGSGHLKKWGLLVSGLPALIRLRRQYDLIYVSGFRVVGIVAVLVSKLLGKTCVLKADSLGEMSGDFFAGGLAKLHIRPSSPVFKTFLWARNRALRRADAFVAISSQVNAELERHSIGAQSIHNIPNGVDTGRFCPVDPETKRALRSELGISPEAKIVTYTGRLVTYKGLPLLVRVWHKLQQEHLAGELLLVGSGGLDIHNCEAELEEYVRTHSLQSSLRLVGGVHNVHEYLQASDLFVLPTESEAFGLALVEAMACGLPVISTSVGGVKDILEHGQNGLVVPPGNYQQLYDALVLLMANGALATRLGKAAWQTVQTRYAMEAIAQQYVTLFTRLVDKQSADLAPDAPTNTEAYR